MAGDRRKSDFPKWSRLVEVALAVSASIGTSLWVLSARLAAFDTAIETTKAQAASAESRLASAEAINAQQNSALAVNESKWDEVQRRLGNIEDILREEARASR